MKNNLLLCFFTLSLGLSVQAETNSIVCGNEGNQKIVSTLTHNNADMMYTCIQNENLCFTGSSKVAKKILKRLNYYDVWGDEFDMRNIKVSADSLQFDLYDGPNDIVTQTFQVPRCQ